MEHYIAIYTTFLVSGSQSIAPGPAVWASADSFRELRQSVF